MPLIMDVTIIHIFIHYSARNGRRQVQTVNRSLNAERILRPEYSTARRQPPGRRP